MDDGRNDRCILLPPKWLDFPGNDATAHEFPVSVVFWEKDGLWAGTLGGGLRKLDLKTGKWEMFTMANICLKYTPIKRGMQYGNRPWRPQSLSMQMCE